MIERRLAPIRTPQICWLTEDELLKMLGITGCRLQAVLGHPETVPPQYGFVVVPFEWEPPEWVSSSYIADSVMWRNLPYEEDDG